MKGTEGLLAPIPKIKLSVPPVHPNYLSRPRLDRILKEAGEIPASVLLVSAPPGYGKSSLLAGWLREQSIDHAWLTLDREDDDPARFVGYLFHALGDFFHGGEPPPFTSLSAGDHPHEAEALATHLSNSFAEIPQPVLLVLDDLHSVESTEVHGILEALLRLQPPNFHLAILTREDPPLSLARLRAQGRLIDIRMEELSFTREETADLLKKSGELAVDQEHVALLQEKTEGWAAAIQLSLTSLLRKEGPEAARFIEQFSGNDRHIIDYLMDELLEAQPPEVISFLEETSQLDRFSAEACDWITDREDSAELLLRLERDNLLILTLDGRRNWFRYHYLFSDFLRTRLSNRRREEINERAASWFQSAEMRDDALRHAVRTAHPERFLDLIVGEAELLLWAGRPGRLLQLASDFEEPLLRENPRLFELICWAYYLQNRQAPLVELLGRPDAPQLPREAALLRPLSGLASPGAPREDQPDSAEEPAPVIAVLRGIGRSAVSLLAGDQEGSLVAAQDAHNRCRATLPTFLSTCVAYNYSVALLKAGDAEGAASFLSRELERRGSPEASSEETLLPLLQLPLAAATAGIKRATGVTPSSVTSALDLYEKIDASHLLLEHGAILAATYLRFVGEEREARKIALRFSRSPGLMPLSRRHTDAIGALIAEEEPPIHLPDPLSDREREVLRQLVRGLSNAEIAEALYISTGTVKWHINRILSKLDAHSRTQAAAKARELGLV